MLGYALSISDVLIQTASIFGILGISFIAVFIGSIFYSKASLLSRLLVAGIILSATIIYGVTRLEHHPTEYSKIKVRIVQPSIKQLAKWNPESFWQNMTRHIAMSQREGDPDIIVWSEAALTVPFYYKAVHKSLLSVFTREGQVLLTGGINDNNLQGDDYELYSSLIALNSSGELLFDYHKSHLVPFGEYMPLKKYLPIKKLTPGLIDYTPGNREVVYLPDLNLKIHALVCYESIFFSEVKALNTDMDLIVNIINDAWYGNSSGPHQHFQISRLRSVENGLPMIRAGNNGISAIIDPLGRVLKKLDLNAVDIIDGYLPYKLSSPTLFSKYGNLGVLFFVGLVLILQRICSTAVRRFCKKRLFT
ncbi:MAG: hypothetical protein Tsb006_0330 [Rickettsiaceae bacterium]